MLQLLQLSLYLKSQAVQPCELICQNCVFEELNLSQETFLKLLRADFIVVSNVLQYVVFHDGYSTRWMRSHTMLSTKLVRVVLLSDFKSLFALLNYSVELEGGPVDLQDQRSTRLHQIVEVCGGFLRLLIDV